MPEARWDSPVAWVPSGRLVEALKFATEKHARQYRKGTTIPYLSHLMSVAAIVIEHGGSEDQAIAALLHDTIEDQDVKAHDLAERFGEAVAKMVQACSHDEDRAAEPNYRKRKAPYIEHLARVSVPALLVSISDKTHNARSIVHDLKHGGSAGFWERFSGGREEVLWYYESLVKAYEKRAAEAGRGFQVLLEELRECVARMVAF